MIYITYNSLSIYHVCVLSCVCLFATPWTSPPGSSVHGILQARRLEWVAVPFSMGSSRPPGSDPVLLRWQVDSLPPSHMGKPKHW